MKILDIMKKWTSFLSVIIFCVSIVNGQSDPKVTVSISSDSILMGNVFILKYSLENESGDFSAPNLDDFVVVSGPNTSSSFSIMNGKMSQSSSYTYYLSPKESGNYYINPGAFKIKDLTLETALIQIIVLPNPEGIITEPGAELKSIIQTPDSSRINIKDSILKKKKLRKI
jgi:hypothetical protein